MRKPRQRPPGAKHGRSSVATGPVGEPDRRLGEPNCPKCGRSGRSRRWAQQIVRKRRRAFDLRIREYIQEGIEDGSIAPCEPKLAVAWLMGSINWIPSWFNPEGDCGPEAIAEVFVNFMSHGLATGSAKIRTRPRKTSVKAA